MLRELQERVLNAGLWKEMTKKPFAVLTVHVIGDFICHGTDVTCVLVEATRPATSELGQQ